MCEVVTILEREINNSGLIYIYQESDGRWYAYEQSAFYLSQMLEGLAMHRYVMEGAIWLARAEVNMEDIPIESVISRNGKECVLHYTPHNGFQQWLAEIGK